MKIGFIGPGKMAQAIISGWVNSKKDPRYSQRDHEIWIAGRDLVKTEQVAHQLGVASAGLLDLVELVDLIILSVKPQDFSHVLSKISGQLRGKTLVSIAAGLRLKDLTRMTNPDQAIIRIMPNVNASVQSSTTAVTRNHLVSDSIYTLVTHLFEEVGTVYHLEESNFSVFAALAGSSPAFISLFIESLTEAGISAGLSMDIAAKIVEDTISATVKHLVQESKTPAQLITEVASPGGSTQAGLNKLTQLDFKAEIMTAILATMSKEKELGR